MLFTPEMSGLLDRDRARGGGVDRRRKRTIACSPPCAMRRRGRGLWVHLGSLAVRRADGRFANRGFVIDDAGAIRARYDKLHLFDVDLPTGESWREFRGLCARATRRWWSRRRSGALGLSICYDLRFPALYRALSEAGATVLAMPAAFTRPTGAAHWHVAAARARDRGGALRRSPRRRPARTRTGARPMAIRWSIDPWGEVLLDMGEAPGLGFAEIDPARSRDVRARIPVLDAPPRDPAR